MDRAVGLLDAMANPLRLIILRMLCGRELCVAEICRLTGRRQSLVSRHLAALRKAEIVVTRKERQSVYYRCESYAVRRILSVIDEILPDILASDGFFGYRLSESCILGEWNSVVMGLTIGSNSRGPGAEAKSLLNLSHRSEA